MRKSTLTVIVVIAAVALCVTGVMQAKEKKISGKLLYREYCRPCHDVNSEHGQYQPLSLIQDQWNRFFDKKLEPAHKGIDAPGQEGKKLLDVLDEEMLKAIRKFAVDHAADSESPQTCG